jgi:glycosyltransferase involved in cell wall biosynthesis
MKLLVVIPTYYRAHYLDQAIFAISAARARATNCEVELFISDNCSPDDTAAVVTRWQETSPWIHFRRWETHECPWAQILKRAFIGSGLDYDYMWLQGDDDYISDTNAYAEVANVVELSAANPPAIIHCCEKRRAHPGDTRVIGGLTEDLCNSFGWHDMLGWISSLVISRDTIARTLETPQFQVGYRNSAFSHSEGFLEAAYGRPMVLIGAGLIEPQDKEQTQECIQRWQDGDVAERYWMIIDGIKEMKDRGVITKPLAQSFFRYHTYTYWDRFAIDVLTQAGSVSTAEETVERKLEKLGMFAELLGFAEDRKLYRNWYEGFRDDVRDLRRTLHMYNRRLQQSARESFNVPILPAP